MKRAGSHQLLIININRFFSEFYIYLVLWDYGHVFDFYYWSVGEVEDGFFWEVAQKWCVVVDGAEVECHIVAFHKIVVITL